MSKDVNKVFLLGRVGKDPEMRATTGGMTIASFSLATGDRKKDAQGNWADSTEWHNLVAFQRTAEVVRDYVKKGTQIFVEGKIQTRSWDDKESGQKKYRTEILVNELTLLGGRGDSAGGGASYERSGSSSYSGGGNSGGGASRGSYGSSNTVAYAGGGAAGGGHDYADQGITDEDIPF